MNAVVIGIGNPYRRDDGAGVAVARLLAAQYLPGVTVIEESGEGLALIEAWQGAALVVVCDAVSSGAVPGSIWHLDAHEDPLPAAILRGSTHAFGLADAVALGRALGQLPARLFVVGIEGEDFGAGEGLSPAAERGVIDAALAVRELLGVGRP